MALTADILVIGAGIVGCTAAFELAGRGASVVVVDDRLPGMGATRASAGVLAPYIEAREGGPLVDLTARSLQLYDTFIERLSAAAGVTVMYRRTGTWDVALTGEGMARLESAATDLQARGVDATLLDAQAVRADEPQLSPAAVGGLSIPCHGFVAAGGLTLALADAARERGVRMAASGRATRISRVGSGVLVETERDRFTTSHVVMAAGAWAGQVVVDGAAVRVPIRPVRGQLLELAMSGPPLKRVIWGERCYLVPWEDGTLLVGATVEDVGFDERNTSGGIRDLIEAATALMPDASLSGFTEARAGLRPASPDHLPVIGSSAALPGLIYATGHYRNGVLLAPLTAHLLGNLIFDGATDPMLAVTTPRRFGHV